MFLCVNDSFGQSFFEDCLLKSFYVELQVKTNQSTDLNFNKAKKTSNSKSTTKDKTKKKSKSSKGKKGAMHTAEPVTGETVESDKNTKAAEEEPKFDENDVTTLLPSEPTLEDALKDKNNLKIMKEGRKEAIELWNLFEEHEWTLVKENGDLSVYKGKTEGSQIMLRRHMVVDAPIDTCIEAIQDHDVQKKINDRIE